MFYSQSYSGTLEQNYQLVIKQLKALIEDEDDLIANLSNASALLNQFLEHINWVGFYLLKDDNELVLGPFQGLPACVRIPFGKGVCGTSVKEKKILRVEDVTTFPGHITCDSASLSEIVIPMVKNNTIIGVLDIDSPIKDRFTPLDEVYLQQFVETLVEQIK